LLLGHKGKHFFWIYKTKSQICEKKLFDFVNIAKTALHHPKKSSPASRDAGRA